MKKQKLLYIILFLLLASNIILIFYIFRVKNNNELEIIEQKADKFVYRPIVVTKSDNIKLGEEYVANIYLACINEEELPQVLVNASVGEDEWMFKKTTDTLGYDEYFKTFIFKNTPSQKGIHYWNGIIVHNYLNKPDTLFYYLEYSVE